MPAQRKIDIVAKLADKVGHAKSLVFTNYQGLTHKQLEELKRALRSVDAEFVVTKNTLLELALEQAQSSKLKTQNLETLQGPTATLFAYSDILAPLKELAKTIKTFKLPTIKFGVLEGKTLTGEEVLRLSALPSREVLLAQLVGQMKAPISNLVYNLNYNIQKLVLTLKAIENKKATSG